MVKPTEGRLLRLSHALEEQQIDPNGTTIAFKVTKEELLELFPFYDKASMVPEFITWRGFDLWVRG